MAVISLIHLQKLSLIHLQKMTFSMNFFINYFRRCVMKRFIAILTAVCCLICAFTAWAGESPAEAAGAEGEAISAAEAGESEDAEQGMPEKYRNNIILR